MTVTQECYHLQNFAHQLNVDMPIVNTKAKLQALLGCLNQLRPFVPLFSRVVRPLYAFLKEYRVVWTEVQEAAKHALKQLTLNSPELALCSRIKQLELYTDWSQEGLGFCLFEDGL